MISVFTVHCTVSMSSGKNDLTCPEDAKTISANIKVNVRKYGNKRWALLLQENHGLSQAT